MSCAKTAEPIEMPFRMQTRMGPRNHVGLLHGLQSQEKGSFGGRGATCDVAFRQNALTAFCLQMLTDVRCAYALRYMMRVSSDLVRFICHDDSGCVNDRRELGVWAGYRHHSLSLFMKSLTLSPLHKLSLLQVSSQAPDSPCRDAVRLQYSTTA